MLANSVVMIRPIGGAFNHETARDNSFQIEDNADNLKSEFDGAVDALRKAGVEVLVVEGEEDLPDAHFPNNWFSTHPDGRLMVYEMAHPSRRAETRLLPRVLETLSDYEASVVSMPAGAVLEGTGSLVFDHDRRLAFAALSPRTQAKAVRDACDRLGYEPILFETKANIYHTNVCLSIAPDWAIICADALSDPTPVLARLVPKPVHLITLDQMNGFGANVLALRSGVAMSAAADRALGRIDLGTRIVAAIPTIEKVGGGSLRCMIAENFLPKRETARV